MTTDGEGLRFDAPAWASAAAHNEPVPPITPAPVAVPGSAIDQLLAALGIASNAGIADDNLETEAGQAEREAGIAAAQANFPANEEQSAQMLQLFPQLLAGAAGAFGGAIAGAIAPFSQLAQQGSQAAQQGLQAGLGAMDQTADPGAELDEDGLGTFPDDFGAAAGGPDSGATTGGSGGAAGGGDTVPASLLGPPPLPSAATHPASAPTAPPASPSSPPAPATPRSPMGGPMPIMPPGAMHASGGNNEPKADTKRVVAPSVKNGAPVQGRITPSPGPAVTKHVAGKPVATRRVPSPNQQTGDIESDPDR